MWNWNQARAASQTSRAGSRTSRTSHLASRTSYASGASTRGSQPRELEFQFFIRQTETLYPPWWTREGAIGWYSELPDDTMWNCYICSCVLLGVVWTVAQMEGVYIDILDVIYNVSYAIHIFAIGYKLVTELENTDITFWTVLGFLVDLGSFAHYVKDYNPVFKLTCYYVRLHRPYKYLWSLTDYNLKGSILGTTLKYCYIFMVLRITWAYVWLYVNVEGNLYRNVTKSMFSRRVLTEQDEKEHPGSQFLSAVYIINKMFIPIGPSEYPDCDIERICCLLIMLTGTLVVTGLAVASLSLVISLYMRPEETFRSRYRLIIKEMKDTQVPYSLREKVKTFYKMYWHKQRAVSETQLLPTFPPTLPATINIDIYFEATQKARILRELSYQMLSELARKMETIHFIPGDAIIKRGSKKHKIIYITYGDVEMLTAEDDTTAILRMTRGTVLTPCGGAAAAAIGLSHLAVRAATFCTAHVLTAANLWRVVSKHSVSQDHAGPILASFTDHIERVKRHYTMKLPDEAIHKSSILNFNRNLMALKDMTDAEGNQLLASKDVFLEIAGCYIMRNRLDAALTDQSDEICLRPTFPCILQPTSSLLVAWHSFVALLILIVCVTHPYYLVYNKSVPLGFRFFDYCMTAVFVVDHIVHLSTGANVEEGVPITFTQTSSQQMRSHWFVLDVVGTLPVFEFVGDGHFAGINKILRLPKLFRVLKSMEETCVYRSNVLRFLSYSLLLLVACYLIAALQQGFMCFQSGYCLVTNFTHPPFWEQMPLDEESVQDRLAFGLYWAISMINFTIHRETWGKDNWKNVIYTMIILEICIVLRIFMEAVYSATIMVTTAPREDYDSRIGMVKSFLIRNDVDPKLRKRFITYLQLCWHTDKAYKMTHQTRSTIFYDLPPHVFQDIVGRNRSKYILLIPFMRLIKKEDLRNVSACAKLFYTSPNEILLNTGELTNEIYVIKQGICEILDPVTRKSIGQLTTKNHFGALICLLRLPAYYTIRAVTHVQVISIPRKHLLKALETPQIKAALDYLKTRPEFVRMQTRIPAFIKYVPPPPTPNMMYFRLPRKHEPDTEFLFPFTRLGFLSILRYVFPRYTIRPDGKYLLRYEWFRVTCALCSAQLFPHYTYLVLQWPYLYYVALFLDLSACYDIVQRMLIGYFNKDGILVYHPSSTAAWYMKGAFLVDVFGCLSLENLESAHKDSIDDKFRVTPTKQFLMLNRMIQLYRLPSAMMVLKNYIERRDILMVIQAIPLFMAMLNMLTCFMVFYSVKIYFYLNTEGDVVQWMIEPYEDRGGSWLHLFQHTFRFNLTETPWNLHIATYFWVVYECTTTGYGVFNPSNRDLMEILFIGMAISTMIITYYSVRIISIRANVNKSLAGFQQHMKDINVYMAREKTDSELQKEIRRYYEYNWEKMGGIDYRGVLKLCDQITLRTDAILHIYGPTFAQCPLLKAADISLLRIIGRAVRGVYFLKDMKILEHDDVVTNMYFVDYGGVEVRVSTGETSQVIRLPRGSVFGNLEGIPGIRSPYNVVATGRLHLLMIKSLAYANITKDFPDIKAVMSKCRTDKKMYILGSESKVKTRRNVPSGPPLRPKKSLLKYIYFQEGVIQIYLLVICLACIYLDMYNAGYQDNSAWLLISLYSLDFCFLLKILTQHSLPLLVTSKNLKKMLLPIRRMYFKLEFRYDLISILPLELLSYAMTKNDWMWFSWLRLNRTFRIATVYRCLRRRNESITVNLTFTTMMAVAIWFTLFVHASSCLWYFIGVMEDSIQPNSSWIHLDNGETHCDNEYICSLYFVITTFTQNGVGDIIPKKRSEVLFVAVLMIISTMVFMVYVGEFSNIIQYQSYRSFSFYSKYLELQDFMHNNRVSKNLVTIVNRYTLHLWRETRGMQVPHFLQRAPLSLRLRVMSHAYLHHITRHHIFEECEPAFLRQLVGCLKLYTYNPGMYVVKESEITNSMYVIHTGKVKETCEEMDSAARVYPAGSYFGILQGLLRNTPYTHSYQTMIKSQVLTLHLDDWEYLLKHFPDSRGAIHKHMRQVGDKDMDQNNWPGGAPAAVQEFIPFTPVTTPDDTTPVGLDKFPGISRHFGRVSEEDSHPSAHTAHSKQSRFSWPTDSREKDDAGTGKEEGELERHEAAIEEQPKMGFLAKFASTAKKLMGRVSDPEVGALTGEGKDELLLEEDEEATEALLAQFEAAKKMAEQDKKKLRTRRQSVFHQPQEEETEKLMYTLDINESRLDQISQTEAQRHHVGSEFEITSPSSIDNRDILNLGRPKSKIGAEPSSTSEMQIAVDMTATESEKSKEIDEKATETKSSGETTETEAEKLITQTPKSAPFARPTRSFFPEPKTSQVTEAIQDSSEPAQDAPITEVPQSLHQLYFPGSEVAHDTQRLSDVTDVRDFRIAKDNPNREPALDIKDIQPTKDLTDIQTTQDSKPTEVPTSIQVVKDDKDIQSAKVPTNIQVIQETKPAEITTRIQAAQADKQFQVATDTTGTQVTQGTKLAEVTTSIQATQDDKNIQPAKDTTSIQATQDTKPAEVATSIEATTGDKDIYPVKDTTGIQATQDTKPAKVATSIEATQDDKDIQPAKDTTAIQATQDTKPAEAATSILATQDDKYIQPTKDTTGIQATQDTKPADVATSIEATQDDKDIQHAKDTTGIQATQDTKPAETATSIQATTGDKDIYPVKDTTGIQATQDTKPAKVATSIEATQDDKDIQPAKDTTGIQATQDTKPAEAATSILATQDDKYIQTAKDTTGIQATQDTKPAEVATSIEATQDDKDIQHAKDTTGIQATQDTKPAETATSKQAAQDNKDIQPAQDTTQNIKPTEVTSTTSIQDDQGIKDNWPAQDTMGTLASQNIEDTKPVQVSESIQAAEHIKDTQTSQVTAGTQTTQDVIDTKPVQATTSAQAAQDIKNIRPAQDTTATQATHDTKQTQPAQVTTSAQATQDIKETRPALETTGTITEQGMEDNQSEEEVAVDLTKLSSESTTEVKLFQFFSDTSLTEDPTAEPSVFYPSPSPGSTSQNTDRKASSSKTSTTGQDAERKSSFSKTPIIFDPHRFDSTITHLPAKDASTTPHQSQSVITGKSTSDVKLLQFFSDTDVAQIVKDEPPKAPGRPSIKDTKGRSESTHTVDIKEDTTNTSASKLNRRFVHVRYEADDDEGEIFEEEEFEEETTPDQHQSLFTLDSDEPGIDKSVGENNEDDDENNPAPSTSESTEPFKKGYNYNRKSSD